MRLFPSWCLILLISFVSVIVPVLGAAETKSTPQVKSGAKKQGSDRFIESDNGTVLDKNTGLMWPVDANIGKFPLSWQTANKQIQEMNRGIRPNYGFTNWRLPSIGDLESLLDKSQSNPALPSHHPFENVQNDFYWSSSTDSDIVEFVWMLDMAAGNMIATYQSYCNFRFLWPVRNAWESAATQRGTVYSSGLNKQGQLGNGTTEDRVSFMPARALNGVSHITAGVQHAIAVNADGTVQTWGDNSTGQLGTAAGFMESRMPVTVAGLRKVVAAAAGANHSVALKADGTVWVWGSNTSGQLGVGNIEESRVPVQVTGLSQVVKISAGANHSVALKADGTVWAWGSNASGQLGADEIEESRIPVQVTGLSQVVKISAGTNHTLAVKADGTVWAWGENLSGQLGSGTLSNQHVPVQAAGLTRVVDVAAGQDHSLALKADGTVWAWGGNKYNQLGPVDAPQALNASPVSGVGTALKIAAGTYHSAALLADGTISVWGKISNAPGQKALPYNITYIKNVFAVAAGKYFTLIVNENTIKE